MIYFIASFALVLMVGMFFMLCLIYEVARAQLREMETQTRMIDLACKPVPIGERGTVKYWGGFDETSRPL